MNGIGYMFREVSNLNRRQNLIKLKEVPCPWMRRLHITPKYQFNTNLFLFLRGECCGDYLNIIIEK